MKNSEIRAQARQNLTGKWGRAALIAVFYSIVTYVLSIGLALIPVAGPIISLIISVPLSYGVLVSMFKLNDDIHVPFSDFISSGLANIGKAWSVALHTILKLLLPIILMILSSFISGYGTGSNTAAISTLGLILYIAALIYVVYKAFLYQFGLFVLYDNPDITGKEAVEKSEELMKGKIWSLFCLQLSFLGWGILTLFTFGIGMFWLQPYMQISSINFYRNLTEEKIEV